MKDMFAQGGSGSAGIKTNKQAIARKYGVKQSEVVYFSVGAVLSGYKVIYDKETQRAYSLPIGIPAGTTAISLSTSAVLVHSGGSVDLGALAVSREEYVTLPGSFTTGVIVNTKNDVVPFTDGLYRWAGNLPKNVPSNSSPETSGGISNTAWVGVGIVYDYSAAINSMVAGKVYPTAVGQIAIVSSVVPSGTTHIVTANGLQEMLPSASGEITVLSDNIATIGGVNVLLSSPAVKSETYISKWVKADTDVSSVLNALLLTYKTVYLDIPVKLTSNVVSALDGRRIIGKAVKVTLEGTAFDQTKGAVELTGNGTEVSGIHWFTTSTSVTPLRMGNVAYGSTDATRRTGVRSNSCTFEGTGFKGPNHGNFVIIGAIYPEVTNPRFIGKSQGGGNMEILGVKGGYVSHGYAENGLLINFHGTSADGTGFPTTDFQFIECEGLMNSADLGDVSGAIGGNNNIKFSRGCSNCKIVGGKFVSTAAGLFNGNDHVIAIQGCSNIKVDNVLIQMNNNGDYKAAFGISDHNVSLTDSLDNVISNCFVQINTPGQFNRILQIQSNASKSVRRNKLINVAFNCYNGSNTVDAICEQTSTVSGFVSDTHVIGCTGQGVKDTLLNRSGLASSAVTYLQGNRIGLVWNSSILNSGVVSIVDQPIAVNVNSSGAIASAVNCSVSKTSAGIWVITSVTSMAKASYTFSSPGTGRYCTVTKTSDFSWTVNTYSNTGTVSDMEFSLIIN